jgi:hypothetical protein
MDRSALLALIKAKDTKEAEIRGLVEALPPGVPAVAASRNDLVDSDGFPRADIDVHQVRIVRNQIARMFPTARVAISGRRRGTDHMNFESMFDSGPVCETWV